MVFLKMVIKIRGTEELDEELGESYLWMPSFGMGLLLAVLVRC